MSDISTFAFTDLEGRTQSMRDYAGNVLLVVNVASKCGFTPQYAGLQALWQRYRERGLVVIGFPCDQFGHQEPGDAAQIRQFCSLDYAVDFPLAAKIEVNGNGAHPLWQWLKHERRGVLGSEAIKWNFTKFLIGRDGRVLERYAPTTKPEALAADIERALGA
ncbi:glutathione peroxidase [Xanthomonas citri pv. fuscans]|uniref:Glutathione peroxidase n=1 Tax=Xanthomonas citri pv. fuscans TaxID=366649 RepID=A0AB34Q4C3_XANCI|nr:MULTISPECIES: glutathione peroxidase [Xanthomonas]MBO9749204.1 glutathione peroxidase [Xanthomonas phaseoli pv. dieffenbachiae]MEE5091555.1 glutathione peroxidase [Xanthomonas euvesicatoria]AMU97973.1 glutathione peroxidase [Xanthomonas citri pv. aurantifolii]AMV07962.1 glutathione peroxidase [Xanthomonas citri pv. aurantifolii]ARE56357.1 glutathione peroxidase [Xanthomonas citri pv. aurantifolii]